MVPRAVPVELVRLVSSILHARKAQNRDGQVRERGQHARQRPLSIA